MSWRLFIDVLCTVGLSTDIYILYQRIREIDWRSAILGMTLSRRQARWVSFQASRSRLPGRAWHADAEDVDLRTCGKFEVFWLYESIEHIENRRNLLRSLRTCARPHAIFAAAVHCRAPGVPRVLTYSDIMGTAPPDTPTELEKALTETSWTVLSSTDCTPLTLPVWDFWINNLEDAAPIRHSPVRVTAPHGISPPEAVDGVRSYGDDISVGIWIRLVSVQARDLREFLLQSAQHVIERAIFHHQHNDVSQIV